MSEARTLRHTLMDADYQIQLLTLECRLFTRLRNLITALSLLGGTAVVGSVLADKSALAMTAGILLAMLPILDVVFDPRGRALDYSHLRQDYCALRAELVAENIAFHDAERRLNDLYAKPSHEIDGLRYVAQNDTFRQYGYEPRELPHQLSVWQRFLRFMA